MNLSPGAAVPLENIKVYNSLGSHEGDRLKNILVAVAEGGTLPSEDIAL